MQLVTLHLLQDSAKGSIRCVCVQHILAAIAQRNQDGRRRESLFEFLKCSLTFGSPIKDCPFSRKVIIIDFPNLGITYNGGWCSATISR